MVLSKKSAVNTFIFCMCMILCYTPMFIGFLVIVLLQKSRITVHVYVYILINTLVFRNSSSNPFSYCRGLSELRIAVAKNLRKMLCKQTGKLKPCIPKTAHRAKSRWQDAQQSLCEIPTYLNKVLPGSFKDFLHKLKN